jgi:hypothetical protein
MSEALAIPGTIPADPPRPSLLDAPRRWLAAAPQPVFALYAGLMAFGTYFGMYAFRRPFAAASFAGVPALAGVDYKLALVIAQVVGYAIAKLIGVRVIAELPPRWRAAGILAQIGLAEGALVLFGLIPPPWNIACLFLDGLALGMVWGMVFGFVEGRRQSDLIGAMLCASFILSSGVVKSVGVTVLLHGIANQFWMPAITGLIFAPLLAVCLLGLSILPPPSAADIAARVERRPMNASARRALLRHYAPGLISLIAVYVALTALRDFRDNFAAEIWTEVGLGGRADIFTWSELPISVVVLGVLAALTMLRNNQLAVSVYLALMGLGLAVAGLASLAFMAHALGPVAWMIAVGGGLYLAYTPYNAMLFDRLIAAGGSVGNAGFLIYVADSGGYLGSVALVMLRSMSGVRLPWARFLMNASLATSLGGLVLLGWAAVWFHRRLQADARIAP